MSMFKPSKYVEEVFLNDVHEQVFTDIKEESSSCMCARRKQKQTKKMKKQKEKMKSLKQS